MSTSLTIETQIRILEDLELVTPLLYLTAPFPHGSHKNVAYKVTDTHASMVVSAHRSVNELVADRQLLFKEHAEPNSNLLKWFVKSMENFPFFQL